MKKTLTSGLAEGVRKLFGGRSLTERIARESEIKGRIKEIHTELGSLSHHWPLGENPAEVKGRIDSLINSHGGGSKANITSGRVLGELAALEAEHATKLKQYTETSARKKQLDSELSVLQEELRGYTYTANVEEVMEHLSKIDGAAQVVASLKNTISEQEAVVAANSNLTVGTLYQTREDLFAESALGKDVAADIQSLEAEIAEKEAAVAKGAKIKEDAERTIVGLKRKLVDAERALEHLQKEKNAVLCHFLISQAEQAGSDYLKAAEELRETYSRLMGLDELIQSLGQGRASFALGAYQLNIPSFQMKVFGAVDKVFSGQGFDTGEAKREEIARLKEIGITV